MTCIKPHPCSCNSLYSIHYANNTTLLSKGNNLDDLIDFTNNELGLVKIDKKGLCQ